jgi:multidrug efflux pump subunit AcrB
MTDNSEQKQSHQGKRNSQSGFISYFANNPVAANLLMVFILVMGLMSYMNMQSQMVPQQEFNTVNIRASYPGAAAQEIEESILLRIEQGIKAIGGVKLIRSQAYRNGGSVTVELESDQDVLLRLDEIKLQLDAISSFPAAMEPLVVSKRESKQSAVQLILTGSDNDLKLKRLGQTIEEELLQLNNIIFVDNNAMPAYEIGIEVKPELLREYGLTLKDISLAIGRHSKNISAGSIKTDHGIISLRYENKAYSKAAFEKIPVLTGNSGEKVYLAEVATIIDGFEERINYMRLNGKNAAYISVNASKEQSIIDVAESVRDYVAFKNKNLPQGYQLHLLVDMTYYLNGRLNTMLTNMVQGGLLVFIILALFLRTKLAFWVMIGLPVTFLGCFWLLPFFGITLNIISLFGFIMVLGIVVDDAIVIGESAYHETELYGYSVDNIVRGAKRVATPATFGVLTTVAVFVPFMFSSGVMASMLQAIAGVVILCLLFSLIESKLILPAHLAHAKIKPLPDKHWRHGFNRAINSFLTNQYTDFISLCIRHRYATLAVFSSILLLAVSLIISGNVRVVMSPKVEHDYPEISIEMNKNVSQEQTLSVLQALEKMVVVVDQQIKQEMGQAMARDIFVVADSDISGWIVVPLVEEKLRPMSTFELAKRWRKHMPELAGVKSINIRADLSQQNNNGDIAYRLFSKDLAELNQAALLLLNGLANVKGLYELGSTVDPAGAELQLKLKPIAFEMGLSPEGIATEIAQSFYGIEAQRMVRDGEEVRVMVRYPKSMREQRGELEHALLTLADGSKIPVSELAEFIEKPGISVIDRESGFRTVRVFGNLDDSETTAAELVALIDKEILPKVIERFPSVSTKIGGAFEDEVKQGSEMIQFMVAGILVVYLLLALPLKSYGQPFIIMTVIPFSLTGAILGHYLLGFDLSMMSFFGVIAAAGVVVNDSLVLGDYVNQLKSKGITGQKASIQAGKGRFRAIVLTSLTTFLGLIPIMFETSLQAQMVIPMAISLSFSVLYATFITLILVPCIYVIKEDLQHLLSQLIRKKSELITNRT